MGVDFTVEKMPESSEPSPTPPEEPSHTPVRTARGPLAGKDWIDRYSLPLVLFALCLIGVVFAAAVGNALHSNAALLEEPGQKVPLLADVPNEVLLKSPMIVFGGLIKLFSAVATLALIVWWFADRRGLLNALDFFPTASPRFKPAVRAIDVGIAWICGIAFGTIVVVIGLPRSGLSSGESQALQIAFGTAGLVGGCVTLCLLSAWRAKGYHGMAGLLPFWTLPEATKPRPLWQDIVLGLVVYVLVNAALVAAGGINKVAVDFFGTPQDQHPLIGDLLQNQPLWVTATIFLAATVGAAFTEEILFRGGLYNVCLRYMGKFWAAILAAAIFSAVHFIKSDFLPLFVLGLAMTWLYERTGRLVASMTFHFVNNAISILTIISWRDLVK